HVLKKQRSHTTTDVFLSDHHKVKIVRNPAYKRNVSIRRGISYRILARHIKQLLDAEPEPDVIVAAIPTVGITRVVQDYAEKRGIPVVVDVRDLWPDIFLSAVPPYLRLPGRFVLLPFRKSAQHVLRRATAITGVSRAYVEWGLSGAGRKSSDLDK